MKPTERLEKAGARISVGRICERVLPDEGALGPIRFLRFLWDRAPVASGGERRRRWRRYLWLTDEQWAVLEPFTPKNLDPKMSMRVGVAIT